MPRTHRGLRQSFVYRVQVQGDVPVHSAKEDDHYDRSHARDILPYAPYIRTERRWEYGEPREHGQYKEPKRPVSDDEVIVRRRPEKEKKRISWDTSGDSVRLYTPPSPERTKSADDVRRHTEPKKTRKKKAKPKVEDGEEERRRRQRMEAEERRRRLDKERQAVEEERRRRAEAERKAIADHRRREEQMRKQLQEQSRRGRAPTKTKAAPRRSRSEEPKKKSKTPAAKRSRSSSRTRSSSSRRGATRSIQKPKWSYVGDPTRRAYVTRETPSYLSDFHF